MHNAPSVSYPVGRSHFAGTVLLLVWLLAAAATGMGWAQAQAGALRWGWAGLLLGTVGLWAARQWWRSPSGALSWDGESWSWSASGRAESGVPQATLDLQRWLLLRWTGADGAIRWFWLERAHRADRWDDLRRAVYSRARPETLPGAEPPAAKS